MKDEQKKMVFYVSFDGMTDPLGQSQVIPYLSALTERGYTFHIFSLEKPDRYEKMGPQIMRLLDEKNIGWSKLNYSNKIPIVSTLLLMQQMYRLIVSFISKESPQLVHFRGYQPGKVCLRLKRNYNLPVVFDMRSFLPEERKQAKIWDTDKFIFRAIYNRFKKLEDQFYKEFDVVVSQTYRGVQVIREWGYNEKITRVEVIPCCADLNFFNYENKDDNKIKELKKELDIEDKVVLGYLGSLGTWYCFDEMLDFFEEFVKKFNAVFLILTPEPESYIFEKANKRGIDTNKFLIRFVKRQDLPHYMHLMDLSMFFIQPGLGKAASSPVKQGELLGMGIQSVVNSGIGDVDLISNDVNKNLVLDNFSKEEYRKLINNLDLQGLSKKKAREVAFKYYNLETGVQKYENIYNDLING